VILGIRVDTAVEDLTFALTLRRDSQPVGTSFSNPTPPPPVGARSAFDLTLEGVVLAEGSYSFDVLVGRGDPKAGRHTYDRVEDVLGFEVSAVDAKGVSHGGWWAGFGPLRIEPATVVPVTDHVSLDQVHD
jgi:hypothetical protein